jgi:hypothetical protein
MPKSSARVWARDRSFMLPPSFRGTSLRVRNADGSGSAIAASPFDAALNSNRRLLKVGLSRLISSAEWVSATYYLRPRRLKMYIGGGVLLLILIILLIIFLL